MQPGDRAWVALGAGVLVYDVCCPKGEMLSEASARYSVTHRAAWYGTVIYIAGHLMHVWPEKADVLSVVARRLGR